MSKKIMLLALAVAAMFALPAAASAQEAHISGVTTFSGHAPGGTLQASGEPTIKSTATVVTGTFTNTTTGNISLEFTGSSAEFLGIKGECHTVKNGVSDGSGVIRTSGVFHVITINNKPAILVTPATTTLVCAGFSRVEVRGSVIGTITSPACGAKSKTLVTAFNSNGTSTQEHITYTGSPFDLIAETEDSGATDNKPATAGLTTTATLTSTTEGTLECT
jgi:hypothetical protein